MNREESDALKTQTQLDSLREHKYACECANSKNKPAAFTCIASYPKKYIAHRNGC